MNSYIVRHLSAEEGLRTEPYKDHLGYWTLGIGHLIDRRKGGALPSWVRSFPITEDEAELLLKDDIFPIEEELAHKLPWWDRLTPVRQAVLISMAFQMGVSGLLKFRRTLETIGRGEYHLAAAQMLESKWARQTAGRAGRLAQAMRTSDPQFLEGP